MADNTMLYLSTTQGRLYSLQFPAHSGSSEPAWSFLCRSSSKASVACMQILHTDRQGLSQRRETADGHVMGAFGERWIVFGDGKGLVTCTKVQSAGIPPSSPVSIPGHGHHTVSPNQTYTEGPAAHRVSIAAAEVGSSPGIDSNTVENAQASELQTGQSQQRPTRNSNFSWVAHGGKPILAIFCAPAFGSRHIFTTTVAGAPMRWWLLPEHTSSSAADSQPAATQEINEPEPASCAHTSSSAIAGQVAGGHKDIQRRPAHSSSPEAAQASGVCKPKASLRTSSSGSQGQFPAASEPQLLANIIVPSGRGCQIVAVDACPERGVLVCGDMAGSVMAFVLQDTLLTQKEPSGTCSALSCEPSLSCTFIVDFTPGSFRIMSSPVTLLHSNGP